MDAQSLPPLTPDDLTPNDPTPAPAGPARGVVLGSGIGDLPRLFDDLAFAAELGMRVVRIDAPWAAMQRRAGATNGRAVEALHEALTAARQLGLEPWVRLLQADVPLWFDDDGGFSDERNAGTWWPRWVESVASSVGDLVAGWVPFEAPYAMALRLQPDDARKHGELMHTLVVAWRDAWRILRGGPPVATSIDVRTERPTDPSPEAASLARRRDQLRWGLWLRGLTDGVVRIPGRADRPLAELDGACDVIGLALRAEVEGSLHRAAEQGPERPLALTFRPTGDTDSERAASIATLWRDVDGARGTLDLGAVVATPFLDRLDASGVTVEHGLATASRRLKDAGEAFCAGR